MPVKPAGKKKLMRCPKCQVIFEVQDTGVRPLPIKCTACGATGAIKK
jgi:PHP family Zn ribbon phosphoesterase